MGHLYSFERLEVWKMAKKLSITIYRITGGFPADEKYGLASQMKRAALSVCSNIAEGCGRNTKKDQANFYGVAYSSLMELLNQIIIVAELGWISEDIYSALRDDVEKISRMLNALRKAAYENG